jgi:hypothetical protein
MSLGDVRRQVRALKAALLYCDDVEIHSFFMAMRLLGAGAGVEDGTIDAGLIWADGEPWPAEIQRLHAAMPGFSPEQPGPRRFLTADDAADLRALDELAAAAEAGALRLPPFGSNITELFASQYDAVASASVLPVFDEVDQRQVAFELFRNVLPPDRLTRQRAWEGSLAVGLLGQAEGFPDAPIDVLLDVRDRLARARTSFRSAIAEVAASLDDAVLFGENISEVTALLRRRVVAPALAEVDEELRELGARATLLRLLSDRVTVATAGAAITLATATGGGLPAVDALAGALLSAPGIAAAATEAATRLEKRAKLRASPFWMLRELESYLT